MPPATVLVARPSQAAAVPLAHGLGLLERRDVTTGADLLAALGPSVAVIVLDERLVFETSGDLIATVNERSGRRIPIILLASRTRAGDVLARARGAAQAVLFEPIDPDELAYTVQRLVPSTARVPPADTKDPVLETIWAEHRGETEERVTLIETAARAALENRLDADTRERAGVVAHQLAGSVGSFGYGAAGQSARRIEELLRSPMLGLAEVRELAEASVALRDGLEAMRDPASERPPGLAVLLVEPDGAMRARIEAEARAADLGVEAFPSVDGAAARVDAVVVALEADPQLTFARSAAEGGVPVIVRGYGHDRAEREAVARIAGAVFVPFGADASVLVSAAVSAIASTRRLHGARILVVDDDPLVTATVRLATAPHGAVVHGITDPLLTWKELEHQTPDLVLLDVEMPGVTGIELCRSMRADARWSRIVVIIFTGLTDPETIRRIWAAGADDYVPKPVGPQLLSRISARLASARPAAPRDAPTTTTNAVDVVVVEDDVILARLLLDSIGHQGLRGAHLSDGAVAAELLAGPAPPLRARVILLDVGLPALDGYGVLRALAAGGVTKTTRVIMLTARASEAEVVRALEMGAFDHVAKPFSVPVLLHRIKRALEVTA